MTVLNSTFRIKRFITSPSAGLNNLFGVEANLVIAINNQSTRVKEYESISYPHRVEIQKIRSFSELEKNWDSYDAQEISSDVISQAVDLIKEIDKLDEEVYFSSPGPNGEVMVELKRKDKEVEIIIYKEKMKYVTFENGDFEKQGEFKIQILPEIIAWLNL